jgi:hypothetical protein
MTHVLRCEGGLRLAFAFTAVDAIDNIPAAASTKLAKAGSNHRRDVIREV